MLRSLVGSEMCIRDRAVTPADTKPATPADTKPPSGVGAGAGTGTAAAVAKGGAKLSKTKNMVSGGTRSAAMSRAASQAGTQAALKAIGRRYITK